MQSSLWDQHDLGDQPLHTEQRSGVGSPALGVWPEGWFVLCWAVTTCVLSAGSERGYSWIIFHG